LRIYVLVTCFEPLRAYTYEQGLARFAAQPYATPNGEDADPCAHLTNYSVNKHDETYEHNVDANEDDTGHKWSLQAAFRSLAELGHDIPQLQKRIDLMLAKTLIAAQPHISAKYNGYFRRRNACFELYGFDVLLDATLRPWLIEVNVSPDLVSSSPLDKQLKGTLATDVLQTVGVQLYNAQSLAEAASAPMPPPPRPDEPPLFVRAHSSGHAAAELEHTPLGALSPAELLLLVEAEEEWARVCHTDFRRIYPSPYGASQARLLRLFEHVRLPDALLSAYSRRTGRVQELQAALDACPEAHSHSHGPSMTTHGAEAGAPAAPSSKSAHPRAHPSAAPASASAAAAALRRRMPSSAPVRRAPPTASSASSGSSRSASATKQRASSARTVTSPGGGGAARRATVGGGSPSAKHNGRRSPSPADLSSRAPARAATGHSPSHPTGHRAPPALPQAPVLPQSASRKRRPSSSDGHLF
jgi:hypothetical protein